MVNNYNEVIENHTYKQEIRYGIADDQGELKSSESRVVIITQSTYGLADNDCFDMWLPSSNELSIIQQAINGEGKVELIKSPAVKIAQSTYDKADNDCFDTWIPSIQDRLAMGYGAAGSNISDKDLMMVVSYNIVGNQSNND